MSSKYQGGGKRSKASMSRLSASHRSIRNKGSDEVLGGFRRRAKGDVLKNQSPNHCYSPAFGFQLPDRIAGAHRLRQSEKAV